MLQGDSRSLTWSFLPWLTLPLSLTVIFVAFCCLFVACFALHCHWYLTWSFLPWLTLPLNLTEIFGCLFVACFYLQCHLIFFALADIAIELGVGFGLAHSFTVLSSHLKIIFFRFSYILWDTWHRISSNLNQCVFRIFLYVPTQSIIHYVHLNCYVHFLRWDMILIRHDII